MNFGLIETTPQIGEQVLGIVPRLKVLNPERNWLPYKTIKEYQNRGFETYACVTFSAWNCIETLFNLQFKRQIIKSDRFTAALSGTKDRQGNFMNAVADCIKNNWSVQESEYPFGGATVEEFYQPIPSELPSMALKERGPYRMDWHWVAWGGNIDRDVLWNALQYSPVQVTVYAWEAPVDGIYRKVQTQETNHAITLLTGVYGLTWTIFDHYDSIIKTLSWDFYFGSAMSYSLRKKIWGIF